VTVNVLHPEGRPGDRCRDKKESEGALHLDAADYLVVMSVIVQYVGKFESEGAVKGLLMKSNASRRFPVWSRVGLGTQKQ
jgi:hypothetical protein